jgi:hypothetical protein
MGRCSLGIVIEPGVEWCIFLNTPKIDKIKAKKIKNKYVRHITGFLAG